jgi:hypothetical protein
MYIVRIYTLMCVGMGGRFTYGSYIHGESWCLAWVGLGGEARLLVGRTAASTLARCCPLLPRLARSLGSARLGSARPEGKGEGGGG